MCQLDYMCGQMGDALPLVYGKRNTGTALPSGFKNAS